MAFSKGGKTRGGGSSLPHRRNRNQSAAVNEPKPVQERRQSSKTQPKSNRIPREKIHRLRTKPKSPFSPITHHRDKKASQTPGEKKWNKGCEEERRQIEQMEKLTHNVVTIEAPTHPIGSSGSKRSLQSHPRLKQGFQAFMLPQITSQLSRYHTW